MIWKKIFKSLDFLKICPIFVGSFDNFRKTNDDIIFTRNMWFYAQFEEKILNEPFMLI